jgi:hypothetical protein
MRAPAGPHAVVVVLNPGVEELLGHRTNAFKIPPFVQRVATERLRCTGVEMNWDASSRSPATPPEGSIRVGG